MWLGLVLALHAYPPLPYAVEPVRPYTVIEVEVGRMGEACGKPDPKQLLVGCSLMTAMIVYLREDLEGPEREAVLMHELAHFNGWQH